MTASIFSKIPGPPMLVVASTAKPRSGAIQARAYHELLVPP